MKRPPKTKQTARRKAAHERLMHQCGFRSFRKAQECRCELIGKKVYEPETFTADEARLLEQLQKWIGLYVKYKTNDSTGLNIRHLDRKLKKMGLKFNKDSTQIIDIATGQPK